MKVCRFVFLDDNSQNAQDMPGNSANGSKKTTTNPLISTGNGSPLFWR